MMLPLYRAKRRGYEATSVSVSNTVIPYFSNHILHFEKDIDFIPLY